MRRFRARIKTFEASVRPGRRPSHQTNQADSGIDNLAMQHQLCNRDTSSNFDVSHPGDAHESHAQQTANMIMGMSASTLHRQVNDANGADALSISSNSSAATSGVGQPLAEQTRNFFEPRFGCNLNHVRIHDDSAAHKNAKDLNARAFTQNNHIGFDEGQYDPHTCAGKHLLAHELTHVTQDTATNTIYRETWNIDDTGREIEREVLVQLIFENTWGDMWHGSGWTPARKNTFRTNFVSSIENTFNNSGFVVMPQPSAIDVLPPINVAQGYKPLVDINLVPEGEVSVSEDWEVAVESNPSGEWRKPSSGRSYGSINEATNNPIALQSSAPGVTQIQSVHEFGHSIGLAHPGKGLEGSWLTPSRLSPGADVYSHTGTDVEGRTVHGPTDLMGGGMGLRPFYYDAWGQALGEHIEDLRSAQRWEDFQRSLDEFFNGPQDVGDFPIPEAENRRMG